MVFILKQYFDTDDVELAQSQQCCFVHLFYRVVSSYALFLCSRLQHPTLAFQYQVDEVFAGSSVVCRDNSVPKIKHTICYVTVEF